MNFTNQINETTLTTIDDRLFTLIKEELNTEEQQQFVNNFVIYLEYGYDDTSFIIDFDDIWKWVGFSRKDNAKTLLIKKFIENKDFILSNRSPAIAGDPIRNQNRIKETILLTVNTFKKFCMKASTDRADEICNYYIKMEKIMFQYTQQKLNEKDQLIEETQNTLNKFIEYDEELFWNENQINKFDNKNVLYLALIGIFNNERIYKFGKTEQIYTRECKQHQKFFITFKMRFVIECDNMSRRVCFAQFATLTYYINFFFILLAYKAKDIII
jgi:phage anti-repressor protein